MQNHGAEIENEGVRDKLNLERMLDSDYKKERLKQIRCFVLDMDGTIYLGDKLFDFTPDFLDTVKSCGKDFIFFTNNSSKNAKAYLEKLKKMGIFVSADKMLISNHVIIKHIKENYPGKSAYVVGTPLLEEDFRLSGIRLAKEDADLVVLGFDTTLTYEKLVMACNLVRSGKPLLGVNPDFNCPVENGFIPDCGSMAALIRASTGVTPEFFGKPSRHTLDYILEKTDCKEEEVAVVGDRIYTDIALAYQTKATSILVLTGECSMEDISKNAAKPCLVCGSLAEITRLLLEIKNEK